jgi:ribosomal protein L11 methylase PrmA
VQECNSLPHADVIMANLYSSLLLRILPKLRFAGWLILSGILSDQQRTLTRALQKDHYDIVTTKRRGKWLAILATTTGSVRRPKPGPANFCGGRRPPLQ